MRHLGCDRIQLIQIQSSQSNSVESNKAKNIPCGLALRPRIRHIMGRNPRFLQHGVCETLQSGYESGELTVVADLPAIRTATCDAKGNIYGVGLDSNLYSISKTENALS